MSSTQKKKISYEVRLVPISQLKNHPKNNALFDPPSEVQKHIISDSIKEKGMLQPVVIDQEGTILSGHIRVMVAKEQNWETVPCLVYHAESEEEKEEVLIESNLGARAIAADRYMDIKQRLEELKEKRDTFTSALLPELKKLFEEKRISQKLARVLSKLPHEEQESFLVLISAGTSLQKLPPEVLLRKTEHFKKVAEALRQSQDKKLQLEKQERHFEEKKEKLMQEREALKRELEELRRREFVLSSELQSVKSRLFALEEEKKVLLEKAGQEAALKYQKELQKKEEELSRLRVEVHVLEAEKKKLLEKLRKKEEKEKEVLSKKLKSLAAEIERLRQEREELEKEKEKKLKEIEREIEAEAEKLREERMNRLQKDLSEVKEVLKAIQGICSLSALLEGKLLALSERLKTQSLLSSLEKTDFQSLVDLHISLERLDQSIASLMNSLSGAQKKTA